jgi:tyrosyl-tRNA synthetase
VANIIFAEIFSCMSFIEELKWRGMIHDIMPGTEEQLQKEMTAAYVGYDPSSDSLHIGNLVSIMMLKHLQIAGHKPIALVGGATGMIGDPSGKSEERNLLDEKTLRHNQEAIKLQLKKFIDFDTSLPNKAELVNNFDWMKEFTFLQFIRDVGKHISVNYMMAKDSVKKRLETGISFTEFTYQLVQGYDFLYLYEKMNCKLQMGGSDQWGNIVTGTELIRRKTGGQAYALTCPLITKSDGGKFGKTEKGNVWLDHEKTSPYEFYQFWLNASDDDAEKYIKIFTLATKEEIELLINAHAKEPHLRLLQKRLAEEVTSMVHSQEDCEIAVEASQILFGKGTTESLNKLDERTFLSIFEGVAQFSVERIVLEKGISLVDLLVDKTQAFTSRGELRRLIQGGGLSLNKLKIENEEQLLKSDILLNHKYLLFQKGKKNYFVITVK